MAKPRVKEAGVVKGGARYLTQREYALLLEAAKARLKDRVKDSDISPEEPRLTERARQFTIRC